ncbi:MAG: hydrolase [Clostridia bacterium]|nr:hydrolase [Clostridia bacterium]
MEIDVEKNERLFKEAYNKYVTRPGAKELLNWIEESDFFTAPASSKFHLDVPGGLCEHSLNVCRNLKKLYELEKQTHPELEIGLDSIVICGLLHDLCKANFYKVEMRNVKNENGQWDKVPYYTTAEQDPWGHGEKSVMLIMKYMSLTDAEICAINWHMGGFDDRVRGGASKTISAAYEKYPLAVLTQAADFIASYIDESKK